MKRPRGVVFGLGFALLLAARTAGAQADPKQESDLEALCLSLCAIQEPNVDVAAMKKVLAGLTEEARKQLQGEHSPKGKISRLNAVLLTNRKVTYISNKYWRDSTLTASLLRRQGNCLSTTTLYVLIGKRLKLPIRAVVIPEHAFARYDDGRTRINIETTTGGREQPNAHYRAQHNWPDSDTRFLGYGKSLTDKQFAALLHRYAGMFLAQANQPKKAIEMIEKAIALWPDNPDYQLDRCSVRYSGLGQREAAVAGYKTVFLKARSIGAKTRALLGIVTDFRAHSQHRQALALLRQAYKIAPKYLHSVVLSQMASSYRSLRRFDEALVTQELATVLGGDAEDFAGLAIFYKNARKLEDAIRCLRRSVKMNPESWHTRLILAGYLIRAGHPEEGWQMFKTVKKPRVNVNSFHTNMAWFYGSVGKKKKFLEHLKRALELSQSPGILNYIKTEVDFDRYRNDPDYKQLVHRHRKRLLGGK